MQILLAKLVIQVSGICLFKDLHSTWQDNSPPKAAYKTSNRTYAFIHIIKSFKVSSKTTTIF